MAELRGELDLAEESVAAERFREFRLEHLERDVAAVPHVEREVYGRHAADAKLALDKVAAREGGVQCRDRVQGQERHSGSEKLQGYTADGGGGQHAGHLRGETGTVHATLTASRVCLVLPAQRCVV